MNEINIGRRIYEYRKKHKLTIKDFAMQTELSTAIISQLERNIANPSLSVLNAIAGALHLSLSELVAEEPSPETLILRKEKRLPKFNPDNKYIFYDLISPLSPSHSTRMTLVRMEKHSETYNNETHMHGNEEVIYMLHGRVDVILSDHEITLYEGDTLRIPPFYRHRYINQTDATSEFLAFEANYI